MIIICSFKKVATPPTGGYHAQPAATVPTIGEPSVVSQSPMMPRQAPAKVTENHLVLTLVHGDQKIKKKRT